MAGLTPAQIQQIQAAAQAGGNAATSHGTGTDIFNAEANSLQNAGGYSPAVIAAIRAQSDPGGNGVAWGNGAAPTDAWAQQLQAILSQNNAATDPANTPDPSAAANQNAVANGGVATTEQQLQNLFQPTYMQTPASGSATQYTGSVDPSATIQQIYANLNPQFDRATRGLNNQLAAAGIEGGSAIDAQQQLQSAETGTLGSALQQAIASSQGYNQQAGLANTAAQNQFNLQNLQNLYNANLYNTQAANGGQGAYANALLGQYNTDANSFNGLNAAQFGNQSNLGYQNNASTQNLAGNLAGNYQVQQGAGAGVANLGNQFGQYFQSNPYSTQSTPISPTIGTQYNTSTGQIPNYSGGNPNFAPLPGS